MGLRDMSRGPFFSRARGLWRAGSPMAIGVWPGFANPILPAGEFLHRDTYGPPKVSEGGPVLARAGWRRQFDGRRLGSILVDAGRPISGANHERDRAPFEQHEN